MKDRLLETAGLCSDCGWQFHRGNGRQFEILSPDPLDTPGVGVLPEAHIPMLTLGANPRPLDRRSGGAWALWTFSWSQWTTCALSKFLS